MPFPQFFEKFHGLDVPVAKDIVTIRAVRSERGLVAFFDFHKDFQLPPHSHGAQWGTVVRGLVSLTIEGETVQYTPGQTYSIPAGVVHAVSVAAGTQAIDVFEEADRYSLAK